MSTKWAEALARACAETGTRPTQPEIPTVPLLPDWPTDWAEREPTAQEQADLRAQGYLVRLFSGRVEGSFVSDRWPDAPDDGDAFSLYRSMRPDKTYVRHTSMEFSLSAWISPYDRLWIWYKPKVAE